MTIGRNHVTNRYEFQTGSLTTYLVISIIIHIVMIIIGEINFKKCPASPNIPVFLIAEGVIGLVSKLLSLGRNFILRYLKIDVILSVMGLVEVTFLICGSVWVYRAFEPKYDPAYEDRYCSRTLYLFSLIFISCVYILTFAFLFMVLCMLIGFCLLVSVSSDVVVEATVPEFTTQPAVQTESV
ncbi:uncharacterized protein LOC108910159 isoform X2 [Anoplophora glabripennis]|uniref:uncharacterized protein LOC108910159 isoform X2 n=1 Tax=Anoplophora glabripennis TaxID=217634 RepID=UPI0008745160|nr:uncharacterized protein LOC108910159 isoform X2 [Anoplophora glabripennis]